MALASFGKPTFLDQLRELVVIQDDGRYEIDPLELEKRFGPKRRRGGPMEAWALRSRSFVASTPGRARD